MPYDPNDPNSPYYSSSYYTADQSSQTIAQQAASLTAAIKAGTVTPAQAQAALPDNSKIVNGVVVPNDPSLLPLYIMAAAFTAPFAVEALTSLASGAAAGGAAADAAPTITDLGAVAPGEFAGAASTVAPTLDTGASLASLSGAGPLASGETGVAPTAAALAPPADLAAPASSTSVLGAGGKLASFANSLNSVGTALAAPTNTPQAAAQAALANQLANNRNTQAKTDQGGPAADKLALQNGMRAAILAGNGAPASGPGDGLTLGGNALPNLTTPAGTAYAKSVQSALAARLAAGKTPTLFGVGDPSPEEVAANAAAANAAGVGTGVNSTLSNVGSTLQTGAKVAGLAGNIVNLGKTIASWF